MRVRRFGALGPLSTHTLGICSRSPVLGLEVSGKPALSRWDHTCSSSFSTSVSSKSIKHPTHSVLMCLFL